MSKNDYYDVLGVDKNANDSDLKRAYRKMAMKYHPDQNQDNPEAEEKFKEVNEAYETLKDPQKRGAYDQFGHAAFEQGGSGGFGGGFGGAGMGGMGGFSDIFEDIFGGGFGGGRGQAARNNRGSDMRYDIELTLEDAFNGIEREITLTGSVKCKTCTGSGAKDGAEPETCGTCHGHGKVIMQQGFFQVERTCHSCDGIGTTLKDPCRTCVGTGRMNQDKTLKVKIPAGVDTGNKIRLSGEGEAGLRGGENGDLYVVINMIPDPIFQRDGAHIHCNVPISMARAALGGEVEIPTINGERLKVKIPEGTQNGHQMRLRGKGMPILQRQGRGDMYIQIIVETPVNMSKRQRELLEEFETENTDERNHTKTAQSFFDKVRSCFKD